MKISIIKDGSCPASLDENGASVPVAAAEALLLHQNLLGQLA